MFKIKHAAFLLKSGTVVDTGPCHDISMVPENCEIESEGFVCVDGSYITRKQATDDLHANHPVQSEELIKEQRAPDLPQLGVENRPQAPILNSKQAKVKLKLMGNAAKQAGGKLRMPEVAPGTRITGLTGPPRTGTDISFALRSKADKATQQHENFHSMMNRVENLHGPQARQKLASNLYHAIPEENRNAMRAYVKDRYSGKEPPDNRWHEEHIAHLLGYLNSFDKRRNFHSRAGSWDHNLDSLTPEGRNFNVKMKQSLRHLQNASNRADKKWLSGFIHKSEINLLNKSLEWKPSEQEIELALDMLHAFHDEIPEFKAAKFMANGYQPNQEEIENALRENDGDYNLAALEAHHLEINDENLDILHKITYMYIHQEEMSKNEQSVAAIPRIVKPFNEQAIPTADIIRSAFEMNEVYDIKLNGKHSKGTAIVLDHKTGQLYLLKPGSGSESPALGINEEQAPQAVRECAFNDCARIMGLGQYVSKSALLILDSQKVSALEFFPVDYKPAEKLKRKHFEELRQIFQRMVLNGLIYKFAALDMILGNVDRHAGNILVNQGWDVKLIDHGSTFAGPSFSPSKDSKNTFIPFYLRVFSDRKFSVLTSNEKYNIMPVLPEAAEQGFKFWIDSIPEGQLVAKMNEYGINSQPSIDRLNILKLYLGKKSEFLRKFFAGVE